MLFTLNDGGTNRTDCALKNSRHGGRCKLCHLLARHNAERQHRDDQIQDEHRCKSKCRRATNVAHILCTARDNDSALDAREDPYQSDHGRDNLLTKPRTSWLSPEVVHKDIDVELTQENNAQHEESQRHQFRQRDDRVNACGLLDATKHQSGKEPQKHASADDGKQIVARTKRREEIAQRAKQQERKAHVGKACADPVAPGGIESNVIAKASRSICIDTAGQVGTSLGQTVEHHHQRKDADKANSPRDDNCAGIGSARGHIAGKREDTAANTGGNDHHGQSKEIQTIGVDNLVVLSFRGHCMCTPFIM